MQVLVMVHCKSPQHTLETLNNSHESFVAAGGDDEAAKFHQNVWSTIIQHSNRSDIGKVSIKINIAFPDF